MPDRRQRGSAPDLQASRAMSVFARSRHPVVPIGTRRTRPLAAIYYRFPAGGLHRRSGGTHRSSAAARGATAGRFSARFNIAQVWGP